MSDLALINIANNRDIEAEAVAFGSLNLLSDINKKNTLAAARGIMAIGDVYVLRQQYTDAEKCYRQAMAIFKEKIGDGSSQYLVCAERNLNLLNITKRSEEAVKLRDQIVKLKLQLQPLQ